MSLLKEKRSKISTESICILNEYILSRNLRKKAFLYDIDLYSKTGNNKYYQDEKELRKIGGANIKLIKSEKIKLT